MGSEALYEPFSILGTYFRDHSYPFTKHHIDSFRELIRRHIPETIASFNPITMVKFDEEDTTKLKLKVEVFIGGTDPDALGIYVDRPTYVNENNETVLLTPNEARLKNYSYMAHLFADVAVRYTEEGKPEPVVKEFKKTWLGEIPIMLHSDLCVLHDQNPDVLRKLGECIYDQGGYFIIDGKEKVVVSQERITTNRLFIEATPKDANFSHRGHIHCTGERGETTLSPRTITFYLIRRELPKTDADDDIKEEYRPYRGAIFVSLPSIPGLYPLFTLFRLLGAESDRQILESIFGDLSEIPKAFLDFIYPTIRHGAESEVFYQSDAIQHVAPSTYFKSAEQVHAILVNDIMPNMNPSVTRVSSPELHEANVFLYENKVKFLGHLVKDFIQTVMGIRPLSDRDGYVFKRVDISGFLLAQLFQSAYIQLKNTCRDMLDAHYHYIIKNKGQLAKLITPENIRKFIQPNIMTEIMNRSLKGRWGPKPEDPDQEIIQDLGRISYIQFLSHLRRVNLPLDRTIKITSPHRLHSQQWGIMCPFESPDGASIGYLKNFALLSHVTFGTESDTLYPCLLDLGMVPLYSVLTKDTHRYSSVYLNGQWVGVHVAPAEFVTQLKLYRRNALINIFTSVSWDIPRKTVRILTEAGRVCRPLFVVEQQALLLQKYKQTTADAWYEWVFGKKWKTIHPGVEKPADLYYRSYYIPFQQAFPLEKNHSNPTTVLKLHQACIDLLDIEEENTCLVAMRPVDIQSLTTHCEIHPSTIFSVVTNNIPFANHNQAPRNIFHGAQSKQAIGIYATNFTRRFDTMGYIQHYPQRPLISTQNAQFTNSDRMPNGFNVIVAVMSYSGYNQEDGIMINKAAIDRGLFNITAYKSLSVSEETLNDFEENVFMNPEALAAKLKDADNERYAAAGATIKNYHPERTNYQLLNEDGVIAEESYIPKGESVAIVGMMKRTKRFVKEKQGLDTVTVVKEDYEDVSVRSDVHHYGRVDRVYMDKKTAKSPYRICKVRFRKVRKPEFGDKHSSRHGQKGVVGLILREEDLPFTKDGIRPDIIINPHAFPSRMTIGHMVECIFAKLCCLEGTLGDGSVFVPFKQDVLCDQLEEHGFERYGNEILYNGFTGSQIPSEIFIGPTFYLRLKHMVADKVHARGVGFMNPHDQLTRQPTAGRSHMGGLRIGEMERDSLLSHGVAQFIKETMMERSDKYRWLTCKHCGTLMDYTAVSSTTYKNIRCRACDSAEFNCFETPFAMKLLIQEMEAMGLSVRLSDEPFNIEEDIVDIEDDEEMAPAMNGGVNLPSLPPDEPLVDLSGGGSIVNYNEEPQDENNGCKTCVCDESTGGSIEDILPSEEEEQANVESITPEEERILSGEGEESVLPSEGETKIESVKEGEEEEAEDESVKEATVGGDTQNIKVIDLK